MIVNELTLAFARKSVGLLDALILIVLIVGVGLLIFVVMIYVGYRAIENFKKGQERATLMVEKILPELFSKFGKVISIEVVFRKTIIKFERNGMLFDIKVVPAWEQDRESDDVTVNTVQFSLPNHREKFFIHHKSLFSAKNYKACESVQIAMPKDFIFYSLNPQFMANLMAKDNIRGEIYKYQKKVSRQFSIAFESGVFTVTWHRSPNDGSDEISWNVKDETPDDEVRRLAQICQTAVVFYDELEKLD